MNTRIEDGALRTAALGTGGSEEGGSDNTSSDSFLEMISAAISIGTINVSRK